MKKLVIIFLAVLMLVGTLLGSLGSAFADGVYGEGDIIITLGEDLDQMQKIEYIEELSGEDKGIDDVKVIEVSIEEERKYLGDYIEMSRIGSRSISTSRILLTEEGSGINVETENINWITDSMYANALVTAGVKDADVRVVAPFEVSGTGALTGLLKAYEEVLGEEIDEEQKQVANEEMVTTVELGDEVGKDEASELMTRIKEMVASEDIADREELSVRIQEIIEDMDLNIDEETFEGIVDLFDKMRSLDIDWEQLTDQLGKIKDNVMDFMGSEEVTGFLGAVVEFFNNLFDGIAALFSGSGEDNENNVGDINNEGSVEEEDESNDVAEEVNEIDMNNESNVDNEDNEEI